MDEIRLRKIISNVNKKTKITIGITIFVTLSVLFVMESSIKYLIALICAVAGLVFLFKARNVSYLLFDECNPQLYYSAVQGISKQVPIDKQMLVAEFIGDYSSAIAIAQDMVKNSKNNMVKASNYACISRIAFFAGNYELCKKSVDDYFALTNGKSTFGIDDIRNEFYIAYINGNYEKAKELLAEINTRAKKPKNSFKCNMLYYNAIVDYSLNSFDEAKCEFNEIVERYPNMYLASMAQKYLASMENGAEVEPQPLSEVELPQSAKTEKPNIKELIKAITAVALLIALIIGTPLAISLESVGATPILAIQKQSETEINAIEETIEVDEKHIVCVYEEANGVLGVAYLEKKGKKYSCAVSQSLEYPVVSDDPLPAKMHTSGKSREIVFKLMNDRKNVDESYTVVELELNDKPVYFCYILKPEKRYFSNLYAVELKFNNYAQTLVL